MASGKWAEESWQWQVKSFFFFSFLTFNLLLDSFLFQY
jgi:hypothetical protein